MATIGIVVPCFNEANRLDIQPFAEFQRDDPDVHFCFVDDGSTDATPQLLADGLAHLSRAELVRLPANVGKGEAVRRGILHVLSQARYDVVGYLDADLATPLDQLPLLTSVLARDPAAVMAFGSRVKLLGREIERWEARHYVGRVFATAASVILGLAVYDTQCGAKVMRATAAAEVFASPFVGRWVFDVEIFARLAALLGADAPRRLIEVPLFRWRDQGSSRIRFVDLLRVPVELGRIALRYR